MIESTRQCQLNVKLPKRLRNKEYRSHEFLTLDEVDKLCRSAKKAGRNGLRDETLIMMMFRHALRVSEAVGLKWDQIDLDGGYLHVRRLKKGLDGTHPLRGPQIRDLRKLKRESKTVSKKEGECLAPAMPKYRKSPYVFVSELGSPLSPNSVHKIVKRAGELADLPMSVHPHMLRHSTGFYLANDKKQDTRAIQGYMGHSSINSTVVYTQMAASRYDEFWND